MKVTLKIWNHGAIGGFSAAVVVGGIEHKVPAKVVGDGHGAGQYVAFDSAAEARQHAIRFAKRLAQERRAA